MTTSVLTTDTSPADRIHRLWDELAEFEVARHDEALEHLLRTLCQLVDAQNASWFAAVRLPGMAVDDVLSGWRPRIYHFLRPDARLDAAVRRQTALIERQEVDISVARRVAHAGTLRVNCLKEIVPADWFASDYYSHNFVNQNLSDAIVAGCPVNVDTEIHFGLLRATGKPRFTAAERETVFAALRSLRWFHRQYLLSHGLLVATTPLTVVEREVLRGLLSGRTEKEIAAAQERGAHTTHEYVKAIYRKFGVTSRAALMALWLGRLP
jgi:DNA-binding CsgD family transcriptional regulator